MSELAVTPKWDVGWVLKGFNGPLRRARLAKGLTQKELATVVGVNVQTLGQIELLIRRPSADVRFQLADFLGLDEQQVWPDWLEPREQALRAVAYQEVDAKTYSLLDPQVRREVRQLECGPGPLTDNAAEREFVRERIEGVLSTLTDREREIVKLRFGVNEGNVIHTLEGSCKPTFTCKKTPAACKKTPCQSGVRLQGPLEECGRIFRISRERVKQIEAKALRKMQSGPRADVLAGLTDGGIACPRCHKDVAVVRYCKQCRHSGCSFCMNRINDNGKYLYVCHNCRSADG